MTAACTLSSAAGVTGDECTGMPDECSADLHFDLLIEPGTPTLLLVKHCEYLCVFIFYMETDILQLFGNPNKPLWCSKHPYNLNLPFYLIFITIYFVMKNLVRDNH